MQVEELSQRCDNLQQQNTYLSGVHPNGFDDLSMSIQAAFATSHIAELPHVGG